MTTVAAVRDEVEAKNQGWFARNHISLHTAVIVLMVIWLIPTLGLLVTSFRPGVDASSSGWWTAIFPPFKFTFENYAHVLGQADIATNFLNSFFISIPATVIPIFVAAFAAYAFSWMEFPGRNILFVVVVGLLVVPLQATLPREVFESAAIDGASPVTAFFRLALPMSVPAIAALAIFQFLFVWNDLLVALVYIGIVSPENLPLPVTIANLVNSTGGGSEFIPAAAFLSMAIPLIVFFGLQRYFVRGIVGGAVKG
jgi:alpha-glucoside transport system permease protein